MLRLFHALPESEQEAQLAEIRARVENFNTPFTELLKARQTQQHKIIPSSKFKALSFQCMALSYANT